MTRRALTALLPLLLSACAGTPAAPSDERVSGVWIGNATLRSAAGGECVGAKLGASIGSRDIFAAGVQQSGPELTGKVAYQGNGTVCSYTGSVSGTTVRLNLTSCQVGRVNRIACTDGTMRDLALESSQFTASGASGTGPGTDLTTWGVFRAGTTERVATLTMAVEFRWNVLRLPNSDFHVFDGSIRPGYVDGTIEIPEDLAAFCDRCGWF